MPNRNARIESEVEVQSYIQNLKYALANGASLTFQEERQVDRNREMCHTNRYTVADLFPNENPADALKRELQRLTVKEYICTVRDVRFPGRSEMREFGRRYNGTGDVYIKIRVELLSAHGNHTVFVMSFHYASVPFTKEMFPYGEAEEVRL